MSERRDIERMIGAVLAPEVRVAGTIASEAEVVPSREYIERFPPAMVVAFGRTPSGAVSPTPLLDRVRATCRELGVPEPLVACDLEQGAGLHFAEGTRFPPALALAAADLALDYGSIELAGQWTGVEARRCGVQLVLAPVADVNTRGDNPIIAVRSFGDDPAEAAERATKFLRGLRAAGAGGCAKHFPGHGDTSQDSHVVLPRVERTAEELRELDIVPFRALIDAGVDTVMVGHLDVPALTGEGGLACTLSKRVATDLLRGELGFRGVVISDAMNMGALARFGEPYVRALAAGVDVLLLPHDCREAAQELWNAVAIGKLPLDRLAQAAARAHALRAELAIRSSDSHSMARAHTAWVQREMTQSFAAARSGRSSARVESQAGEAPAAVLSRTAAQCALRLSTANRPWASSAPYSVRDAWPPTAAAEVASCVGELRRRAGGDASRVLVPVVCEARAMLGRYGPSAAELDELERTVEAELAAGRQVALAWFGSPQTIPASWWHAGRIAIVLAFAPTPPMFDAVARWLAGAGDPPRGSLPAKLG